VRFSAQAAASEQSRVCYLFMKGLPKQSTDRSTVAL
jgi:hypothetical protein